MFQKFLSSKLPAIFNVILLSLVGVTLVSAHGGNTALIHACVNNTSGEIKIVGANANCPSNYRALDWNIQGAIGPAGPVGPMGPIGPQGLQGEQGSQGLPGLQGIQGPAGISGLEVVNADSGFRTAAAIDVTADCPDGKQVIGGGFSIVSATPGNLNVRASAPIASNRWGVSVFTADFPNTFPDWSVRAIAICANVAP